MYCRSLVLTESLVWGDIGILQRLNSFLEISFKKNIFEIVYIVRSGHGLPVYSINSTILDGFILAGILNLIVYYHLAWEPSVAQVNHSYFRRGPSSSPIKI